MQAMAGFVASSMAPRAGPKRSGQRVTPPAPIKGSAGQRRRGALGAAEPEVDDVLADVQSVVAAVLGVIVLPDQQLMQACSCFPNRTCKRQYINIVHSRSTIKGIISNLAKV